MYVLYCPHCSCKATSTNHPVSYGDPRKHCPHCNKIYIDPYCTEPALRDYRPLTVWHQLKTSLPTGIMLAALIAIAAELFTQNSQFACLVWGIGTPVFWLLSFLLFLLTQRRHECFRLKTWQESDHRLRDPKYAAILARSGYQVPGRYLSSDFQASPTSLHVPCAAVKTSTSFKKRTPPPYMPTGSEFY